LGTVSGPERHYVVHAAVMNGIGCSWNMHLLRMETA